MPRIFATVVACLFMVAMQTLPAFANEECWATSSLNGYSAFGESSYRFEPDRINRPTVLCFTQSGGTVSGTDIAFTRVGPSTLFGLARGENVEVYQIDRARRKMLFVRSKVGQKALFPILDDAMGAFVGDAVRIK